MSEQNPIDKINEQWKRADKLLADLHCWEPTWLNLPSGEMLGFDKTSKGFRTLHAADSSALSKPILECSVAVRIAMIDHYATLFHEVKEKTRKESNAVAEASQRFETILSNKEHGQ